MEDIINEVEQRRILWKKAGSIAARKKALGEVLAALITDFNEKTDEDKSRLGESTLSLFLCN